MPNALVPEFAVSDCERSKRFYCELLGFACVYERPEEGFCYLKLGDAELMIDQIGEGRIFADSHLPESYPFGKGLNVQIRVQSISELLENLKRHGVAIYLALEDKWYRRGEEMTGNRQFMVADPDGYLLRFYEDLGLRSI